MSSRLAGWFRCLYDGMNTLLLEAVAVPPLLIQQR